MPEWRDAIRAHLAAARLSGADEADIVEELQQHLDDHYDERRRLGDSEDEARRSALAQLGEPDQLPRLLRAARPAHPAPVAIGAGVERGRLRTLLEDFRIGARLLRRAPAFTVVAVLTLALGIGANSTAFSILNALLLRPIPGVADPDALVLVGRTQAGEGFDTFSLPDYLDYRATARTLSGIAAHFRVAVHLSGGGASERLRADVVSADYFRVLGLHASRGRFFLPEEDRVAGAHPVVVIGHGLWERRYGADPGIVGRSVLVNARPYIVVGVAPPGFTGVDRAGPVDLFIPIAMIGGLRDGFDSALEARDAVWLELFGRLARGATPAVAERELQSIARRLEEQHPASNAERGAAVIAGVGYDPGMRELVQRFTTLLLAVVALVLLIACANVANLLLARASARQRELSIRSSLGASRARLMRQLFAEGMLLALLGGVAGLVLGVWTSRLLVRLPIFTSGGARLDAPLDGRVLAFTAGVALLSTLVFGLPAAWRASRVDLASALRVDSAGSVGGRTRLRGTFLVAQLALSLVLLVGAGLFLRTLGRLYAVDPGFETRRVLVATADVALQGYDEPRGRRFYADLEQRAAALPGVRAAALAYMLPLGGGGWDTRVYPTGVVPAEDDPGVKTDVNVVTPGYFGALGMPVRRGRTFAESDHEGAPAVAVVNEAFAAALWPGQDPVGRTFRSGRGGDAVEVVGVVGTAKYRSLTEAPRAFFYRPFGQVYQAPMTLHLVADGDPRSLVGPVRRLVSELDANLPTHRVETLADRLGASIGMERSIATLVSGYGLLALLVAAVGLYGSMAWMVARRTREIGIRIALGARASTVLAQVLREAARLALIGMAIGLAIAVPAARLLRGQLFGVSSGDPVAWATAGLVLCAVSLAAAYLPARRATRVDPVLALRSE